MRQNFIPMDPITASKLELLNYLSTTTYYLGRLTVLWDHDPPPKVIIIIPIPTSSVLHPRRGVSGEKKKCLNPVRVATKRRSSPECYPDLLYDLHDHDS